MAKSLQLTFIRNLQNQIFNLPKFEFIVEYFQTKKKKVNSSITLILIKPHVLKHPYALQQIHRIIEENFRVEMKKTLKFSKDSGEC